MEQKAHVFIVEKVLSRAIEEDHYLQNLVFPMLIDCFNNYKFVDHCFMTLRGSTIKIPNFLINQHGLHKAVKYLRNKARVFVFVVE